MTYKDVEGPNLVLVRNNNQEREVCCRREMGNLRVSWLMSHFSKALKMHATHCLAHQIQEPLPMRDVVPWHWLTASSEGWPLDDLIVCDLPKVTAKVGNHEIAPPVFRHFISLLTPSPLIKCQLWARYCATCQGYAVEWYKIPNLQRLLVSKTKCKSIITLHSYQCYNWSMNGMLGEHKGTKIRFGENPAGT